MSTTHPPLLRTTISKPVGADYLRFLPTLMALVVVCGGGLALAIWQADAIIRFLAGELAPKQTLDAQILILRTTVLILAGVVFLLALLATVWLLSLVPNAVEIYPDHLSIVTTLRRKPLPFHDLKAVRPLTAAEFRAAPLLSLSTITLTVASAGAVRLERRTGPAFHIGLAAPNAFLSKCAAAVEAWRAGSVERRPSTSPRPVSPPGGPPSATSGSATPATRDNGESGAPS